MLPAALSSSVLKKRIPTLLGLGVLIVGLIVGTIVFSQGTGVFSPRATPETTPKLVKTTNVTDRSFTVTFLTESSTTAFIKYGTEPNKLTLQAGDDRDQIYGTIKDYNLHHISASSLEQRTTYYYVIGTDQGALYDDNGEPFSITTAVRGGTPPDAKTIFGAVTTPQGSPAAGSIVYAKLEGAGELSQLVQDSGSWAIPLSNSRKQDGSGYAVITAATPLALFVQSFPEAQTTSATTSIGDFEMGSALVLGQSGLLADGPNAMVTTSPTVQPTPTDAMTGPTSPPASDSGLLRDLLVEQPTPLPTPTEAIVLDLTAGGDQVVTTQQPLIEGNAPAGVEIQINIHSQTAITQQVVSNSQGEFSLDLAALGSQLEPGTHTVEYSYTDPTTGQLVTNSQTFTVADSTVQQLAQANISPTPTRAPSPSPTPVTYGTDYPYGTTPTPTIASGSGSMISPTPSIATTSGTPSPTQAVSTRSSVPSTESGLPVSGSTGTTLALLFGGIFFLISGVWSFWVAKEID